MHTHCRHGNRDSVWPEHCRGVRALSRYRSVVALCTIVCLTSAPNVVAWRRTQGYRQKTRGRRGIRGNSAKKNKSKTTRIFRRARLFLEHAATSWSNELQSLASSPGRLDREISISPDRSLTSAATRPPHDAASLTSTLYVRQAAPVSITSQPMPRVMIAASSCGSRKALPRSGAEHDDLRLQREHGFEIRCGAARPASAVASPRPAAPH